MMKLKKGRSGHRRRGVHMRRRPCSRELTPFVCAGPRSAYVGGMASRSVRT
jgi:hypothetical protein